MGRLLNLFKKRKEDQEEANLKSFLDMIAPSVIWFGPDHYVCGNTYRCVWALRSYPSSTGEQALLRHLSDIPGVCVRVYLRLVTPVEEHKIIQSASKKHLFNRSNTHDVQMTVAAENDYQDVRSLIASLRNTKEPLLHCAVFLELSAPSMEELTLLRTSVQVELQRNRLTVDHLILHQLQGFYCVSPIGFNALGTEYERVLPASSVANLYPYNYSGKTDPCGFYIGKDKFGSNIPAFFFASWQSWCFFDKQRESYRILP